MTCLPFVNDHAHEDKNEEEGGIHFPQEGLQHGSMTLECGFGKKMIMLATC